MSTKFKDSKLLHEKRRRLNYETPSFLFDFIKMTIKVLFR